MEFITTKEIRAFREHLELQEKSAATITKYLCALEQLKRWIQGKPLEKKALLEFRRELSEHLSAGTVNGYMAAVNAYLKFIERSDLEVGLLRTQRKPFLEEHRELTEAEYRRLVAAAERLGKERLALALMTLGGTGIRVSELRYVTAEAVRAGRAEIYMKGKNRTILLEKRLRKRLADYAEKTGIETGPVFCTRTGRPLDRTNLHHEMKKLCGEARVDPAKVFPHNFRHLFARVFFSIEKNLAHLADVLGHSCIETTRIYVAATAEAHGRILSRMGLVT